MSCKTCERLEALASQDVLESIEEQLSLETDLASNELKEKRLIIYDSCHFFQNQTCIKCGCYAMFRASLEYKKCPIDKW
ncbi:DUF6171 family protein [Marinilactibacillus psychrotolerans]|uniref:DUF6171 family protein n=3 Tax=Marinilactibacillus psychrotolerans TaxID=191770 RepID=A0A5R9C7U6_9LACT|nr:DUF6171 family protein [Marinilactibacillus psychrotolerans]TLQ09393.1 hypothetical protein FEZ48_01165 [Marinilactibacillus psychrotolerans]